MSDSQNENPGAQPDIKPDTKAPCLPCQRIRQQLKQGKISDALRTLFTEKLRK